MVFINYKQANLATGSLQAGISAAATSMILKAGEGGKFPSSYPYMLKIEKYDPASTLEIRPVIKREIVKVTNKVGDTFTIVRSAGYCPFTDVALTQTNTAASFDANDSIFLVQTAEDDADVKAELARLETDKLSIADYLTGAKIYAASGGGTDSYAVTPTPAWTSYTNGASFKFLADVGNIGSASLNISGLGAIVIKKLHDQDLVTGDIEVNQIVEVVYHGGFFQMVSQTAIIVDAITKTLTDDSYYPGEAITAGDHVFLESMPSAADSILEDIFGSNSIITRREYVIFGDGNPFTTKDFLFKKYGSPSAGIYLQIQPDSGGSPSGTPVTNGTSTIASGTPTGTLASVTATFAGSVTLTLGQKYWLVVSQVGDVVNASNYYSIGVSPYLSTARLKKYYNGTSHMPDSAVTQSTNVTYSSDSNSQLRGWRITANQSITLTGVTWPTGFTGYSRCQISNPAGSVLATSTTFIGRTFLFNFALVSGTDYRIELDNNGGALTYGYVTSGALPPGPYVTFQAGSSGGADHSNGNSIESLMFGGISSTGIPYMSTTGLLQQVLSLTDATYSYKVDLHGIASTTAAIGTKPTIHLPIKGTISNTQSGLTDKTPLFLTNIPGASGATAGTNRVKVGDAVGTTGIKFDKRLLYAFSITPPANNTAIQNTYGKPLEYVVGAGTVSVIATSKDNVTYLTKYTATNNSVILQPGDWIKLTYSVVPTSLKAYYLD